MRAAADDAGGLHQCRICGEAVPAAGARRRAQLIAQAREDKSMLDRFQPSTINAKDLPNSLEAVNDYFYEQGWTDGLPIIPPTPERVEHMLTGMSWRSADALIGFV